MHEDYTSAQLYADMMSVIQENAPTVVGAACLLAAVLFVVNWFMYAVFFPAKNIKG